MEEEDLKAELTCPICMDLFREPRRLPCGHVYCRVCLQDMLTRKYLNTRASERILSCPECRQRYDLTFQSAGVDVFTRDFKLFRLVELFEKKFSRGREDGEGDGGAGSRADDQTAVKTVATSETERESSPQTAAAAAASSAEPSSSTSSSSSHSQPASARSSVSQEQAESVPPQAFHSPVVSLSDDSWVFVPPGGGQRAGRPVRPPAHAVTRPHHHHHHHHHQQRGGTDLWSMPVTSLDHGAFPVEGGQDVRGSASTDVSYRTLPGGEVQPVTVSGRYDNVGPETFQRYALDEPSVQLVRLPANPPPPRPPVASPSSESTSESETSDERGSEGDEVSGSGSDVGSHGRNRRSRLSRFFRSLVMSDTDSYDDDDDEVYPGVNGRDRRAPPHYRQSCGEYRQRTEAATVMASVHPVREERGGEGAMQGSVPDASYYEQGAAAAAHQPDPEPPHSRAAVAHASNTEKKQVCDTNHNSMLEMRNGQRNAGAIRADIAAHAERAADSVPPSGAVGGVGRAVTSTGRARATVEISEDSDEEYEPQTSMLRPKRKPRSRLKKFFTSLLSLSSSDEDDEDVGEISQGSAQPSSSNSERQ